MSESVFILLSFFLVFMVSVGCLVIIFRILTSQLNPTVGRSSRVVSGKFGACSVFRWVSYSA